MDNVNVPTIYALIFLIVILITMFILWLKFK
jgi:hypothetical protein